MDDTAPSHRRRPTSSWTTWTFACTLWGRTGSDGSHDIHRNDGSHWNNSNNSNNKAPASSALNTSWIPVLKSDASLTAGAVGIAAGGAEVVVGLML